MSNLTYFNVFMYCYLSIECQNLNWVIYRKEKAERKARISPRLPPYISSVAQDTREQTESDRFDHVAEFTSHRHPIISVLLIAKRVNNSTRNIC